MSINMRIEEYLAMLLHYITYDRDQHRILTADGRLALCANISPSEIVNNFDPSAPYNHPPPPPALDDIHEPKSSSVFRPRWLLDVSNMALVHGSDVRECYYTLSYSWNQSGNYFKNKHNDEYTRDDEGKHQINYYRKKKTRKHPRGRTKSRVPGKHRLVKFEMLLQQICKDFGVRFLWWDQWCINQSNTEETQKEIKQMHRIYKSAYCTLVLIPELDYTGFKYDPGDYRANIAKIIGCEWIKRAWTLEEAFMSQRLLFIGRNAHMYSRCAELLSGGTKATDDFLYNACKRDSKTNACVALRLAWNRKSTKEHDRYFALANIFPDRIAGLNFSYKQPLFDLKIDFYKRLAENDASILYFGAPTVPSDQTNEDKKLPSWTGVNGVHVRQLFNHDNDRPSVEEKYKCGLSPADYSVVGNTITVTCTNIPVFIDNKINYDQSRPLWTDARSHIFIGREVLTQGSPHNSLTFVTADTDNYYGRHWIQNYDVKLTHFLPMIMEKETYVHTLSSPDTFGGVLSLTEECTQCVILFGMSLPGPGWTFVSPVVTRIGDHYKAIGVCLLISAANYSTIVAEAKQFVIT